MSARQNAPALLTKRLALRGCVPGDADALAAIFADPEVMRFIHGGVYYCLRREYGSSPDRQTDDGEAEGGAPR